MQPAFFSFFQSFEERFDEIVRVGNIGRLEVESDVDEEEIPPVKFPDAMNATSTLHQWMSILSPLLMKTS